MKYYVKFDLDDILVNDKYSYDTYNYPGCTDEEHLFACSYYYKLYDYCNNYS